MFEGLKVEAESETSLHCRLLPRRLLRTRLLQAALPAFASLGRPSGWTATPRPETGKPHFRRVGN
jgi:hypothetical protein